jgi:hypothetical protein
VCIQLILYVTSANFVWRFQYTSEERRHSSPNVIRVIKSGRIRWVVHVCVEDNPHVKIIRRFQIKSMERRYYLPNKIRVIKSRRMKWAGNVA